jgi:hypothetical protein
MFEEETRKLIEEIIRLNEERFQEQVRRIREREMILKLPEIDREKEKEKAG